MLSKIPVIEYSTKDGKLTNGMLLYMYDVCAFYSGIIYCFLNNQLDILKKVGVKVNIEKTYYWKPDDIILTYESAQNEIVIKIFTLRHRFKVADNIIKLILFSVSLFL